jgi:hypothetical protein
LNKIDEIALGVCSDKMRLFLKNIREQVLHGDFDDAEAAVAEYISGLSFHHSNAYVLLQSGAIGGIDTKRGLNRYGGDINAYVNILRSFVAGTHTMLKSIEEFYEDELNDYLIIVHSIKGSCLDFYAEEVGEKARLLEEAARAGDTAYIKENNHAFIESVKKLIIDIDNVIRATDNVKQKPIRNEPDRDALLRLAGACELFDLDGVNAAMDEIEQYQYKYDEGLSEWLRESVDNMSYTQINERLSAMGIVINQ